MSSPPTPKISLTILNNQVFINIGLYSWTHCWPFQLKSLQTLPPDALPTFVLISCSPDSRHEEALDGARLCPVEMGALLQTETDHGLVSEIGG